MSLFIKRWNELSEVKRELADRDWFPATSGNLAIKVDSNPLTFLVTTSGKDKRKQSSEDFLLVDAKGQLIGEQQGRPSAETLLHVEIYRRTHAGCSLHVHTVNNNVISELYHEQGSVSFKGQEIIKAFNRWNEDDEISIPIIHNHADIPTLAAHFGENITEDAGAILIRNHGITVWGKDAFEAKKYLEACEFLFDYHLKLKILQKPYAFN